MRYGEIYKNIAERLLNRTINDDDGVELVEIERVEDNLNIRLPAALREYYLSLGRISEINDGYNNFIKPARDIYSGNIIVFLDENQVVSSWGYNLDNQLGDNPIVFTKLSDESEWTSIDVSIQDFICETIYLQLAWGGFEYNGVLDSDVNPTIEKIDKSLEKVVDRDSLRIWYREGILIYHLDRSDDLMGAAREESGLEWMKSEFNFEELY